MRVLYNPWLLALFAIAAFLLGAWYIPLFDKDEGAFAEATREMLERGEFLVTWLNGEPRHDKPILIYWLQAISVTLLGRDEIAFRLPSILAALAWAASLYRFTRETLGRDQAGVATLSFVTALIISLVGKWATADALLNLFLALTMFDAWRFAEHRQAKHGWRVYLWLALGFMVKGPVALAIPIIAGGLWALWSGRLGAVWALLKQPAGWAAFLLVAAPWYVINLITPEGRAFLQSFFLEHNLQRFTATREGHGGLYWYFLAVTPLLLLPFTGWLLSTLQRLPKVLNLPLDRFLWLWFFTVFAIFSLSATQLPHYIVYGLTPLFVLFGRYHEQFTNRWLAFTPPVLFFALLAMVPGLLEPAMRAAHGAAADNTLGDIARYAPPWYYSIAATCALIATVMIAMYTRVQAFHGLLLVGLIQMVFLSTVFAPTVAGLEQQHIRAAGRIAADTMADETIVAWGYRKPSFSVYRDAVTENRPPIPGEIAFARGTSLPRLLEESGLTAEVVFSQGNVVLARIGAPEVAPAAPDQPSLDAPMPTEPDAPADGQADQTGLDADGNDLEGAGSDGAADATDKVEVDSGADDAGGDESGMAAEGVEHDATPEAVDTDGGQAIPEWAQDPTRAEDAATGTGPAPPAETPATAPPPEPPAAPDTSDPNTDEQAPAAPGTDEQNTPAPPPVSKLPEELPEELPDEPPEGHPDELPGKVPEDVSDEPPPPGTPTAAASHHRIH
jgi:4-amino-4-deoxy-L-arabinose transferase-like glycosyltransferase